MESPSVPVGFDYAQAVREIHQRHTYDEIAEMCGFGDKATVSRMATGNVIPKHPQGEAIWALYLHLFGHKPPMSRKEAIGAPFVEILQRHTTTNSA